MSATIQERVRAGMELVSWTIDADDWRKLAGRLVPPYRPIDARLLIGGSFLVAMGVYAAAVVGVAGVSLEAAGLAGLIGGGATGAGGIFGIPALRKLRRRWAYDQWAGRSPLEVTLTSTGILIGDEARLWKGQRWELARVAAPERGPLRLELTFRRRGWGRPLPNERFVLPLPGELRRDARDVARTLWDLMRKPASAKPD